MELEQRVKVLEQEVKLLKNEVQATLLDIQEQLLSTRSPALRTEAALQPDTPTAVYEVSSNDGRSAKLVPLQAAVTGAPDNEIRSAKSASPPSAVDGDSGNNGRPAKPALPPASRPAPITAREPAMPPNHEVKTEVGSTSPTDWDALSRQADWTIRTVRKLGPERTRQLIEVYTRGGLLSEKVSLVLQRLAAAFQSDGMPAENEPGKKTADRDGGNGTSDKAQLRNPILRIIHHLQSMGAGKETSRG